MSGIFLSAPISEQSHGPSLSPKVITPNKTPSSFPKGKVTLHETIISFANCPTPFLPIKSFHFCTAPQSSPLLARWDASRFMNGLIKSIGSKFAWLKFCYLIKVSSVKGKTKFRRPSPSQEMEKEYRCLGFQANS